MASLLLKTYARGAYAPTTSRWFRGDRCRVMPARDDIRAADGNFFSGWIPSDGCRAGDCDNGGRRPRQQSGLSVCSTSATSTASRSTPNTPWRSADSSTPVSASATTSRRCRRFTRTSRTRTVAISSRIAAAHHAVHRDVRFLPLGRQHGIEPYVGGGLGIFNCHYSEAGDFIDFSDNSIFSDKFVGSGTATGPVILGGVRIPIGPLGFGGEVRWQSADGDLPAIRGILVGPYRARRVDVSRDVPREVLAAVRILVTRGRIATIER